MNWNDFDKTSLRSIWIISIILFFHALHSLSFRVTNYGPARSDDTDGNSIFFWIQRLIFFLFVFLLLWVCRKQIGTEYNSSLTLKNLIYPFNTARKNYTNNNWEKKCCIFSGDLLYNFVFLFQRFAIWFLFARIHNYQVSRE